MKTNLLLLFILIFGTTNAQIPDWLWAKSTGGNGDDIVKSVAADIHGNVYAVGYFSSPSIVFGSNILYNYESGTKDMFIVKYDPSGNVLWAKAAGGSENEDARSVSTDKGGNVYVGGSFQSDSISFDAITLSNPGSTFANFYIVKYDDSGNALWAKSSTNSPSSDAAYSLCASSSGNVLLTGAFQSNSITFDTITVTNFAAPNVDFFIVKYNSSGHVLWAKEAGGSGHDLANAISAEANGDFFVCGYFSSPTITFGGTTLTNSSLGTNDFYTAKYDSDGNALWAKSVGGIENEEGRAITTDNSGNVYVGGSYQSTPVTVDTITFTNPGLPYADLFLVKYNAVGDVLWAKNSRNSTSSDASISVCTDKSGDVIYAGAFQSSSITIGSFTLNNHAAPNVDFFIAKYNSLGDVIWAEDIGGTDHDLANSICLDDNGNLFAGGYFASPSLSFGTIPLTNNFPGVNDIFVAKTGSVNGITEPDPDKNMTIYPNPCTSSATIHFISSLIDAELNIYNLYGQKIKEMNHISGDKITIDRGGLKSGIYFINITRDNKEIMTSKIVIAD